MSKFFVSGEAIGKGSTSSWRHPRTGAIITQQGNARRLYAWQKAVAYHARQAGVEFIRDGPVKLSLRFSFLRPKNHYRKNGEIKKPFIAAFPRRPDLDKAERSILDSLTQVAYSDDSQVQKIESEKIYCDVCPGVEIEIQGAK